jgi:anti-anti-sigma factor
VARGVRWSSGVTDWPYSHHRAVAASHLEEDRGVVFRVSIIEVDKATAEDFRAEVEKAIGVADDAGESTVRLDLGEVRFMDSSGLRVLLEIEVDLAADDRRLELHHVSSLVGRLLAVTGLESRLLPPG